MEPETKEQVFQFTTNMEQNNDMYGNQQQQNFHCVVDQSNINLKQEFYLQNINIQPEYSENQRDSSISNQKSDSRQSKVSKNFSDPKLQEKLQKNKISARKTRERKKLLVNLLEQKVQSLENELKQAKQETQCYKQILENLHIDYRKLEKQQYRLDIALQQMKQCIENQNENNDFQLQLLLDSVSLRKGPNSFIYHQYLDILQKGILNSTFTPITRYMLYLSTKSKEETTQIPWIKQSKICKYIIDAVKGDNAGEMQQLEKLRQLKNDMETSLQNMFNMHKVINDQLTQFMKLSHSCYDQLSLKDQGIIFLEMLGGLQQEYSNFLPSKLFKFLDGSTRFDMPENFPVVPKVDVPDDYKIGLKI